MDTELLKTFLEVSKTRHFGRAAESLYLTQSAVSFRIRQLETNLGANLFTRHRNNIRLTAAGERLVPYAEALINTWQLAKQEINHASVHNPLSIGATASLWEACLTPWLGQIYQSHADLRLETRIASRQSLVKQLHARELDLLISTEQPKMDELKSEVVGEITLQLFSIQPLSAENPPGLIRLEWSADFQQHDEAVFTRCQSPVLTTSSAFQAKQLLSVTSSVTYLPAHWKKIYPELNPVDNDLITKPLYAVWLQNSDQQGLIGQLIAILV